MAILDNERNRTLRFSCGARSAFNREKKDYLRSTLSRRQLQALVRLPRLDELVIIRV